MNICAKPLFGLALVAGPAAVLMATPAVTAQNRPQASGEICIDPEYVHHTATKDARTVLFYMRDGTVWENSLAYPCPELAHHNSSFSMVTHGQRVCSNQQSITVATTGMVCRLGEFHRVN